MSERVLRGKKWNIYHIYKGKMVVDIADHMDHFKQHYREDPEYGRNPIAATIGPMPEPQLKNYLEYYGVEMDTAKREGLRPYTKE